MNKTKATVKLLPGESYVVLDLSEWAWLYDVMLLIFEDENYKEEHKEWLADLMEKISTQATNHAVEEDWSEDE